MKTIAIHDDRGRLLEWRVPPRRVVSLVPSDTCSLVALGAGDRLVGRTRYCLEPAGEVEAIEVVGGTKDADVERIIALAPDLVVANQEENTRRDVERLDAAGLKVLVSFPRGVWAGVTHLARLAAVLGYQNALRPDSEPWEARTRALVAQSYRAYKAAAAARDAGAAAGRRPVKAFVPIWMDPLMTVNGDTFISDMLALVGAENVFADRVRRYPLAADLDPQGRAPLPPEQVGDRDTRYPRVTLAEVVERQPELILLPDEPHPFTEADAEVFRALALPAAKSGHVVLCDGKDLMWYGARSAEGIERLRALVDAAR